MPSLTHLTPRPRPAAINLTGHTVHPQSLDWTRHGPSLASHPVGAAAAGFWDYLPFEPFNEERISDDRLGLHDDE